jgi:hypothetical protein
MKKTLRILIGVVSLILVLNIGYANLAIQSKTGNITFNTSGSSRMIIDESGNVGIGTTGPEGSLHVIGVDQVGDKALIINGDNGTGDYILDLRSGLSDNTDNTFVVMGDGQVGIGRDPEGALDVSISPVGGRMIVEDGSTEPGVIVWGNNVVDSPAALTIYGDDDDSQDDRAFEVFAVDDPSNWNSSEATSRFLIKSDGNIGIGTTDPNATLHVVGDVNVTSGNDICIEGDKCLSEAGTGGGDVYGPAGSTDNAIARFDGTGGKTLQDSGITIDDANNMNLVGNLTAEDHSAFGADGAIGGDRIIDIDETLTIPQENYGLILEPTFNYVATGHWQRPIGLYVKSTSDSFNDSTYASAMYGIYDEVSIADGSEIQIATGAHIIVDHDSTGNIGTIRGIYTEAVNDGTGNSGAIQGIYSYARHDGAGGPEITGGYFEAQMATTESGVFSNVYGVRSVVDVDNNTVMRARPFYGTIQNNASINTDATGLYLDLENSGTISGETYGIYINDIIEGTQTSDVYGIFANEGDWALDEDGNGEAGDSTGGDLFLGEDQDLELYHNGTNSYVVSNTGDLYVTDAGSDDVLISTNGGNVGIGTTDPNATLHVVGDVNVTSGNDICIEGDKCLSDAGTGSGDITEVVEDGSTILTFTGCDADSCSIGVSANDFDGSGDITDFGDANDLDASGDVADDSHNHVLANVDEISSGIGSEDMEASEDFGDFTCSGADGGCALDSGVVAAAEIGTDAVSDDELDGGFSWTLDADLNINSNTLVIDQSESRVGIGITTPNKDLTVNGDANITGTVYAHNYSGNSDITFVNTSGDAVMVINDEGNVGIGTTDSSERLHLYTNQTDTVIRFQTTPSSTTSEGPNSPDTIVNDSSFGSHGWTSPEYANSSDGNDASKSMICSGGDQYTEYLKATDFDFSISEDATILGIKVEIEKSEECGSCANIYDERVRIVKGGAIGSTDKSDAGDWPDTDTYVTHGGDSDLWGESWTASDINSENFGVAIAAKFSCLGSSEKAHIDHIRITVYYKFDNNWAVGVDESDSNKFKISNSNTSGSNDYMTIDTSGNVGIGTTDPANVLHVKDASWPQLRLEDDANGYLNMGFNSSESYAKIQTWKVGSGAQNIIVNAAGGNVGIGTTAPGEKLQVAGNINVTSGNDICIEGGNCLSEAGSQTYYHAENTSQAVTNSTSYVDILNLTFTPSDTADWLIMMSSSLDASGASSVKDAFVSFDVDGTEIGYGRIETVDDVESQMAVTRVMELDNSEHTLKILIKSDGPDNYAEAQYNYITALKLS